MMYVIKTKFIDIKCFLLFLFHFAFRFCIISLAFCNVRVLDITSVQKMQSGT